MRENCETQISESAVARGVNADKQRSFKDRCVTDPTMFRELGGVSLTVPLTAFGPHFLPQNRAKLGPFSKKVKENCKMIARKVEIFFGCSWENINKENSKNESGKTKKSA